MLINNNINCSKPRHCSSFKGSGTPENAAGKMRYKHYEEISDEVLSARCIIQAHKQAENSKKMQLCKAMPVISAAIIGTGLSLAQPGKLATKAAAGLGFLALYKATNKISDLFNKKDDKKKSPIKDMLLVTGTVLAGAYGAVSLAKKAGDSTKIGGFVKKEIGTLAKEINSTKAGKFVEKTIEPFIEKHKAKVDIATIMGSMGIGIGLGIVQGNLAKSVVEDIKKNAKENFQKSKAIQKSAKEHFDSIDAVEV